MTEQGQTSSIFHPQPQDIGERVNSKQPSTFAEKRAAKATKRSAKKADRKHEKASTQLAKATATLPRLNEAEWASKKKEKEERTRARREASRALGREIKAGRAVGKLPLVPRCLPKLLLMKFSSHRS